MVRWMVAALACCAASAVRAEKPPTERQRMACRVYAEATKDLAPAVAKQRAAYAEAKIGDISYALPDAAEAAAKAAQKAQQDADGPLKTLQEKVEDLNYQLRLCAR